ncbi:MAG: SRPBCC family protein [Planctomycetota bacterium]
MKKFLLFLIVAIAAVLFVVPQFLSTSYAMDRSTTINAPAASIHEVVSDLQTWNDWTVWNTEVDPSLKWEYTGEPGAKGHSMSWKSDDLGNGSVTITEVNPTRIAYDMIFEDDEPAQCAMVLQPTSDDSTEVKWEMGGEMTGPAYERYFGLLADRLVGPAFEEGLANLKTRVEAGPAPAAADGE